MFKPDLSAYKQATPEDIAKRILRGDVVHYDGDYHCSLLLALFMDGQDIAAFCAWNGICRATFYNWTTRYKQFGKTYEVAKELSRCWYESKAQMGLDDPSFNNTIWSMIARNRFDHTEHRKIKIKGLDKAKSFNQQIKILVNEIAKGNLTGNEVNQLATFVSTSARVDEITQLKADVEMLKGLNNGTPG